MNGIIVFQTLIQDIAIEIDAVLDIAALDVATTRCQVKQSVLASKPLSWIQVHTHACRQSLQTILLDSSTHSCIHVKPPNHFPGLKHACMHAGKASKSLSWTQARTHACRQNLQTTLLDSNTHACMQAKLPDHSPGLKLTLMHACEAFKPLSRTQAHTHACKQPGPGCLSLLPRPSQWGYIGAVGVRSC